MLGVFGAVVLVGCSHVATEAPVDPLQAIQNSDDEDTDAKMEDEELKQDETMEDEVMDDDKKVSGDGSGVYLADGSYTSPNGPETIKVELTLENGVITNAVVTPQATHAISIKQQTAFAAGINDEVVGKTLDEAKVTVVGGSSLTGGAFNEAVDAIKEQI